ncbi:D-erythronate dehydrogenase [Hoeflea prorocentri]|uniref:SDR family oxidoreductase n=1 Tax=Hoeflea prorocentri TaxID=1922333 RepID=A0A9X3UHV9_9HYPH|nr:D-erythronate dehydrogenase [Hoeflea prorocentri]MCY6379474.1 SDR family oxidoreductase [Hoeflea prorocentri]MDA5397274.1 SDR family oxidoreductase [Hoeflea prorocentri]
MDILITGAAGMVGRKLTDRLCRTGTIGGKTISSMTLFDVVEPAAVSAPWPVEARAGDLCDPAEIDRMVAAKPDVIFHLAAIVSGEAELDFDKGYRTNLNATLMMFEAIRAQSYCPRVVFTSSIGVFGAPYPEIISDEFLSAPLSSYGVQKSCGELLLMDYSRKGFFDGISIRLPTVMIRPGKPNKASTSFFSNILREPLVGKEAVLPVPRDLRHWYSSPRATAGFLTHAAEVDLDAVGPRRALTMPGITATVAELIEALGRVAGQDRVALIREEPDAFITRLVSSFPTRFDPARAIELGFVADQSIDEIIRIHIEDELGGQLG